MANTLGELVFDLVLNDKEFHTKLRLAQASLRDFDKVVKNTTAKSSSSFAGMASSLGSVDNALKKTTQQMGAMQAAAQAQRGGIFDSLTQGLERFESTLTTAMKATTAAVVAAGTAITVLGARLENTLNQVAVIGGGGADSLSKLTEAAKRFGSETEFSAQAAADAMLFFAQAGFETEKNIAATESAIALASASGSDLAQTAQVVSNAITQFGLQASDSERIANTFTYALNASKLGMSDLSVSMRYAGTVGAGFGLTLEETSAAIIQLADLGLRGSKSGTVFRSAMSQAANATGEAEKALNKYGLTQEDINPQTQKFAGILKVVAENNIEVSDALKIFGDQAGANIVQLARNNKAFDEGTREGLSYAKALRGIAEAQQDSLAASTAEKVSKTVFRQFLRLTSIISNFADDIYKTYSRQLLGLIEEAILLTNEIAQQFGIATSIIEGGFGPALEGLTDFIRNNRTEIAAFAVSAIQTFSSLAGQVVQLAPAFYTVVQGIAQVFTVIEKLNGAVITLLPMFDNLLDLMISVWAVNRVYLFVTAVQGAITTLQGFSTAATTAKISAELLAGGWVKTVAVLATLAVALTGYIALTAESEEATRRLADAQERQRLMAEGESDAEMARVNGILALQKERALGEIASGKAIDAQRRREIDTILQLDAAGALLMLQKGKLIELDGELRTAASLYEQSLNEASFEKLTVAYRRAGNEAEVLKNRIEALRAKVEDYSNLRGQVSEETAGAAISAGTGENVRSLEEAQALLVRLTKQYEQRKSALVSFRAEAVLAEDEVRKSTLGTQEAVIGVSKAAGDSAKAFTSMSAAAQNAAEATSELYNRIVADFEKATQDQRTARAKALEDQIAQDRAAYDQLIAQAQAAGQDTSALEFERIAAEGLRRSAAYAEALADAKQYAEQLATQTDEALRTEQEKRSAARRKELQDTRDHYATLLAIDVGGEDRKAAIRQQAQDAERALQERYAAEDAQRYRAAMDEINGILAEASADAQEIAKQQVQATMTEYERSIAEGVARVNELRAAAIAQIRAMEKEGKLSPEQVAVQLAAFEANFASTADAIMRQAHQSGLGNWAETFIGKGLTKVLSEEGEAKVDQFITKFRSGMQTIKGIIGGVRSTVGTLGKAFGSVISVMQDISGFSFNVLGIVKSAVTDIFYQQKRAGEEAAKAAEAAGMDPEAARRRAMEANDPASLGVDFVKNLADQAVQMTDILVKALGPILSELGKQIPVIIDSIVVAIPRIVAALVSNIKPIIKALVEGVPEVAVALIKALPDIVTALVDTFFTVILPKLPEIVFEVVKAVLVALAELGKRAGTWVKDNLDNIKKLLQYGRTGTMTPTEGRSNRAAYSGIDYVPATMRATLHQGEAVIPADRNMQRFKTAAPAPAGYAQNFGGGPSAAPSKVEVAVIAEGRLLEAVQLTAQSMGRANGMSKKIRRAAGVQVGFFRGQFNPFSV